MKKINTHFELEAGSVTTKNDNGQLKFLTIFRVKMNDYTLPKGHVEEKETLEEASARETLEETGYQVKLIDFIDSFEYKVKEEKYSQESYIIRRAYYFLGEVVGNKSDEENPDNNEGKIIATWLSYEDALDKLTYESDKNLIREVFKRKRENINNNDYARDIYYRLLEMVNKDSDIKNEILKIGIIGSVNDGESVRYWSDMDILFIIKSDELGNINTDILLKLKTINKKLSYIYHDIEISFLTHTYNDFEKYVSFGYLEYYKFATFDLENDDIDFVKYIDNIIVNRNINDNIKKRYSTYHLRHFRFNLIRKVISTDDNKNSLKMIIDKIIETMIIYSIYFNKNIKGKYNRINELGSILDNYEIVDIYKKALEKRNNWEFEISNEDEIKKWLDNFRKIENFLLESNLYDTPEELINQK